MPAASDIAVKDGLRLFSPAASLAKMPESFFAQADRSPGCARRSARRIQPAAPAADRRQLRQSRLARRRLRRIDRPALADEILKTMKTAGYAVRESDLFAPGQEFGAVAAAAAAIVGRMQAMWKSMRGAVIENFPAAPGLPKDTARYLGFVDDIYKSDANHSLSIEGYSVTPALIERVQQGNWDLTITTRIAGATRVVVSPRISHRQQAATRSSRAATGRRLHRSRRPSPISPVTPAPARARTAHTDWYRELFQPCVAAGPIPPAALAGYRNDAVYLRTSRYVPPRWEALRDAMPALFDLIEAETEPSVRAVLGHWLFGYIHPYPDGNGRMARFLTNAMLASGGYPWTVIRVDDRNAYLAAVDRASVDTDIARSPLSSPSG